MPSISEYTQWIKVALGESGKYFLVLLLAVLAIRLWRRLPKLSDVNRQKNLALACVVTGAMLVAGYLSAQHSLSLFYRSKGLKAFLSGDLGNAATLFQTSSAHWKNAEALGKQGTCLLLLNHPTEAKPLLQEAIALRNDRSAPFEDFYQGIMLFFHEEWDQALPVLEAASKDPAFNWNATKLIAAIHLEKNEPAKAMALMKPFLSAEVTEVDQAYVVASLQLSEGKKAEAKAILDKYPSQNMSAFWKARFDKLRSKIQS